MSAKAAQYVVQGFSRDTQFREHFCMPSQQAKLHANANHCLVKQAYYHRKKTNQSNSCRKTGSILEKKGFFPKFSHLNESYAFLYLIRERHACKRGQLTWLDCFEQKYLSIYISFSRKPF